MTSGFTIIGAAIAVLLIATAALAASRKPADTWSYYYFDGRDFRSGRGETGAPVVAVRTGMRPVFGPAADHIASTALPDGTGAVAGICFISRSGGKMSAGATHIPCSHTLLPINANGSEISTVQTDDQGAFVIALSPGSYTVGTGPLAVSVRVDAQQTSLVALRAGKRMVD